MSQLGNILFDTPNQGGQQALVSEGTGVPVFDAPNKIRTIKEVSGVRVSVLGDGSAGLYNRLNYFFVDQYGAVGDGVTDDTAAIQSALTAMGAAGLRGAVLFFPPGNYLISAVLNVPAIPVFVMGSGSGNSTNGTTITQQNDTGVFLVPNVNSAGTIFQDITLVCTFVGPVAGTAVHCDCRNIRMLRVLIVGFFNGHVSTLNTGSVYDTCGFIDQTNHCLDFSNSASPDQGDTAVINCGFDADTISTAVGVFQQGSGGLRLISCKWVGGTRFVNCIESDFPAGFSTADLTIVGCSIEQFTGYGISVQAENSFQRVTIVGCNITSFHVFPTSVGVRIVGLNAAAITQVVICGNCIAECWVGIGMDNAGTATGPVRLLGNTLFSNNTDTTISATCVFTSALEVQSTTPAPLNVSVAITHVYGGATGNVLGEPDGWLINENFPFSIGPENVKIPFYLGP